METRDVTESELRADEENGQISGLAAVFYRKSNPGTQFRLFDDVIERVMEDAFDRALAENDDVVGLFNHDSSQILGRRSAGTLELTKTPRGLQYRIDPPDSEAVNALRSSIKRGDINGSSFQFRVQDETWREDGEVVIREINKVQLIDVGPVTFPAYAATNTKARSTELRAIADATRHSHRIIRLDAARRRRIVELLKIRSLL